MLAYTRNSRTQLQIISFLSASITPGRTALSSYLLDLDGKTREMISASIEQELAAQPTNRRSRPYSSHGGMGFTVFCYSIPWVGRNAEVALDHARALLLVDDDDQRLLLELSYADDNRLIEVNWQSVKRAAIPFFELDRLKQHAAVLRARRVETAKAVFGKIGRNKPCACGNGKKYKNCHGRS